MREQVRDRCRLVALCDVDPEEVWNVIEQDLQPLKEQIEKYLAEME